MAEGSEVYALYNGTQYDLLQRAIRHGGLDAKTVWTMMAMNLVRTKAEMDAADDRESGTAAKVRYVPGQFKKARIERV